MIPRDHQSNNAKPESVIRSTFERWKLSGSIIASIVLVAAVLLSIALVNRYRLGQAVTLIDQGEYNAARRQLDAMLPLFVGDRDTHYHTVLSMHFKQMAMPLREEAEQARQRAEAVNAPELADELWLDALHTYEMGVSQARHEDWASAAQSWEYAAEVFNRATRRGQYANDFLADTKKPLP